MSRRSLVACALVMAAGVPARAEIVDATSTTLLSGHADARDGQIYTVVPVYEMVSLLATDLSIPYVDDVRIELSGWGQGVFGSPADNTNNCKFANASISDNACVSGDLDLGNIQGKLLKRRVSFKLGRQFVTGGAARITQLDGLSLEAKVIGGLGLQAYGGVPVTPRFAESRGDAVGGGRLFYRFSVTSEVGLSTLYELGAGRLARDDLAIDGRYKVLPQLTFTGYALYSLYEMRIAEATAAATIRPVSILDVTLDYRRVAPDLFLPRNSILSVFSQETRDEAGLWVTFHPITNLRIYGDYHLVSDDTGLGQRGGIKASYAFATWATLGGEGRFVQLPNNQGYVETRLYGNGRFAERWTATLNLSGVWLNQDLNGRDWSYTATATLGCELRPGWRAVITAMADSGPFVDGRLEAMAKLVYNGSQRFHESTPTTPPAAQPEVKK